MKAIGQQLANMTAHSLLVSTLLKCGRCGSKTRKALRGLKLLPKVTLLTTMQQGKSGLHGALFSVGSCILRVPDESGPTGGTSRQNTLCVNPSGSGVKQVPSCFELSDQGLLCVCSRKASTCGVSSCESQLWLFLVLGNMLQGRVNIPFVSLSLELQLISPCYSVCIGSYAFSLCDMYGCV